GLFVLRRGRRLLVRECLVQLALEQLDRVVYEVGEEVLYLLFRQLDIFERGHDLVVGEEPFFLSLLDKLVEFLDVRESDLDGEHGPRLSSGVDTERPSQAMSRTSSAPALTHRRRIV